MDTINLISDKSCFCCNRFWKNVTANEFWIPAIGFLFIALVSIHDTYLVVIEEHILKLEKNPICAYLIRLEPNNCSFFILGKMIGAFTVIISLMALYRMRYAHANLITGAVVIFQAALVMYLHLSDPLIGDLPNFMLLFNG